VSDLPATIASSRGGLIGEAPSFLAMLEHVSRAAALAKPVLVIGERGTGKELIAARLHYLSPRWEQPLVKVNCAALTETLLETELFGHQAGAFTGATRTHIGRFEQANGGTLVLDELGTIPLRMQEKILRVIEYGEFERVGGSDTLRTDVRIVGATNENLPHLVELGRFRPDLLDRLAFDVVHVPPLRARPEDIRALAQHFAVNVTSELKRPFFPGFAPDAVAALLAYEWPGNVRELKNAIERSVYRAAAPDRPLEEIRFDPFASPFATRAAAGGAAATAGDAAEAAGASTAAAASAQAPAAAPKTARQAAPLPKDFRKAVAEYEVELLQRALARAQFKQTTAARSLGLTYHQFRSLLRKHGLNRSGETAD
jgi:psp operon transcriptional activator